MARRSGAASMEMLDAQQRAEVPPPANIMTAMWDMPIGRPCGIWTRRFGAAFTTTEGVRQRRLLQHEYLPWSLTAMQGFRTGMLGGAKGRSSGAAPMLGAGAQIPKPE
mmetsp:Transcript_17088/g.48856  ORF Transcript_17088/g.48856 Transcript_17088/m.48856 type:complete len:108 (-) Transcript_17088:95-418(-)